jgi:hypothetical protein
MIRPASIVLACMLATTVYAGDIPPDRCRDVLHRERHDPRHIVNPDGSDEYIDKMNEGLPWAKQRSAAETWDELEAYVINACKRRPKSTLINSLFKEFYEKLAKEIRK